MTQVPGRRAVRHAAQLTTAVGIAVALLAAGCSDSDPPGPAEPAAVAPPGPAEPAAVAPPGPAEPPAVAPPGPAEPAAVAPPAEPDLPELLPPSTIAPRGDAAEATPAPPTPTTASPQPSTPPALAPEPQPEPPPEPESAPEPQPAPEPEPEPQPAPEPEPQPQPEPEPEPGVSCADGLVVMAEFVSDDDDGCRPEVCDDGRGDDGWCLAPDYVEVEDPGDEPLGEPVEPSTDPGAHPCERQVDSADGLLGICTAGGVRYCFDSGWDLCPGGGGEPCPADPLRRSAGVPRPRRPEHSQERRAAHSGALAR